MERIFYSPPRPAPSLVFIFHPRPDSPPRFGLWFQYCFYSFLFPMIDVIRCFHISLEFQLSTHFFLLILS